MDLKLKAFIMNQQACLHARKNEVIPVMGFHKSMRNVFQKKLAAVAYKMACGAEWLVKKSYFWIDAD